MGRHAEVKKEICLAVFQVLKTMGRGFDLRRFLADIWGQLIYGNNDIFVFYGQQTTCLGGISAEASEMRSSDGQLMKTSGALSDTRPAAA